MAALTVDAGPVRAAIAAAADRVGRDPAGVDLLAATKYVETAVIVCEDGGFFRHDGLDYGAIEKSIKDNIRAGRFVRGASTGRYLSSGHLMYSKAEQLMLVPFDLGTQQVTAAPMLPTVLPVPAPASVDSRVAAVRSPVVPDLFRGPSDRREVLVSFDAGSSAPEETRASTVVVRSSHTAESFFHSSNCGSRMPLASSGRSNSCIRSLARRATC